MKKKTTFQCIDEEIQSQIVNLSMLPPGTPEYKDASKILVDLYDTRNDDFKNEMSKKQLKSENCHKAVGHVLTALGIIGPLVFNSIWMKNGFEYEKDGIICSSTFKWLINGFKTKK